MRRKKSRVVKSRKMTQNQAWISQNHVGPGMEMVEGVLCLLWIESVQWYGNDRKTVRKVVTLCSNNCLLS